MSGLPSWRARIETIPTQARSLAAEARSVAWTSSAISKAIGASSTARPRRRQMRAQNSTPWTRPRGDWIFRMPETRRRDCERRLHVALWPDDCATWHAMQMARTALRLLSTDRGFVLGCTASFIVDTFARSMEKLSVWAGPTPPSPVRGEARRAGRRARHAMRCARAQTTLAEGGTEMWFRNNSFATYW